jgi:CspA family cold shock protein
MSKGTIRWIGDQRNGFITPEQGEDLFFNRSEFQGVDFDSLRKGQEVEFEVRQAFRGRPEAIKVRLAQAQGNSIKPS